ncbi:MAG: aminotransferase class I/II-fold pyridoxal phosphate-dependent enzyme [Lachnospiraceae bacterium]|nr:aminotransferase class I/II-fold pyridoxal phosphate-dependent enzyme [Lachnospiraceae bacterium]
MILFQSDYTEGACPEIMERLLATNMEQTPGYSEDVHCMRAAELIQKACNAPDSKVHFLVGGTQTNMTVIGAALRPYQGVLSAETGHIHVHETGAVESLGYKVLALPAVDGKIQAEQIDEACTLHKNDASFEHMVQPKMVYLSQPTELGTLYTKKELEEIRTVCDKHELYLFIDGARLGYGLVAGGNDVDLEALAKLTDVFYIGGTKVGALFGEAVVIKHPALQKDFRYMIKQKGGMLAKGRLLGVQFETLFENGLYMEVSKHAIRLADKLREALIQKEYSFFVENTTNQIFPIMEDTKLEELKENFGFCYQTRIDENHSAVRFCTSWATKEENVDALIAAL